MDSSKLSFKLFADAPADFHAESLVPVLHSWIQNHTIPDHLQIDVADYSHVHNGPGVVLVSREANYSIDKRGGRLGLTYQRKQPFDGSLIERIQATLNATKQAAQLLEGHLKFRGDEIEFRVCDRLAAPNNSETFNAVKPDLLKVFPGAKLEQRHAPAELFEVIIKQ